MAFPFRFDEPLALLVAASTLFESSSRSSRDSSSSLFDDLFRVVDVAAFTGVAFFFELAVVVVSASPFDSSSSSCVL